MDEEYPVKNAKIFDKGCTIPNIKSLTFNKSNGMIFNAFYQPQVEGFPQQIANFKIPACKPKEEIFGVKVRVKLNKSGIFELTDVYMNEEFTVEEKIEIK